MITLDERTEPMADAGTAEPEGGAERRIPGRVQLMTDEPLVLPAEDGGPRERIAEVLNRRPWLVPAAMATLFVVFLALRRRR